MGPHRFFAPDAEPGRAVVLLPDDEAHHLRHVLRLDAGADVVAFDGRGHEWRATVGVIGETGVQLSLAEATAPVAEPAVKVTLGVGVLKGDQMDAVVRDASAKVDRAVAAGNVAPNRARMLRNRLPHWAERFVLSTPAMLTAATPRG